MPRLLSVSLALTALGLGACSTPLYFDDPPPRFNTYGRGDNPPPPNYAPPVNPPPAAPQYREPIASDVVPEPPQPQPRVTPPPAPPQQLPSGTPVAGKPGFVTSPYAPRAGYVDTRGFSPGEQVKCPYSGKIFLVP